MRVKVLLTCTACVAVLAFSGMAGASVRTFEQAKEAVLDEVLSGDLYGVRIHTVSDMLGPGCAVYNFRGLVTTIDENGYFFLIDDMPLANWGHDCRYVFVPQDGGSVQVVQSDSPPTVVADGVHPADGGLVIPPVELVESAEAFDSYLNDEHRATPSSQGAFSKGSAEALAFREIASTASPVNLYALLINGGYAQYSNHIRYWGDLSNIYSALVKAYGYRDDHIWVSCSDGTSPAVDQSDGTSSPQDLDGDGDADITHDSTYPTLTSLITQIAGVLGPDDHLFVFWTDHGSQLSGTCRAEFMLWNYGSITDQDFASRIAAVNCATKIYTLEPCYSGGYVDDLCRPNEVVCSAANCNESSWAGDTYPYFDEFAYEWTAAVRWCYPGSVTQPWIDGPSVNADDNSDGHIDMEEAFDWAVDHDDAAEHPMYCANPSDFGAEIGLEGPFGMSDVEGPSVGAGSVAELAQSEPNPSSGVTTIRFSLSRETEAKLAVYDCTGRLVATLLEGVMSAGDHITLWNGRDSSRSAVAAGVYFYRLSTPDGEFTKRMVLLR